MVNIHDIFDRFKRKVINKDGSGTVQDQNQGVKIKRTFALIRKGVNGDLFYYQSIFQYDVIGLE